MAVPYTFEDVDVSEKIRDQRWNNRNLKMPQLSDEDQSGMEKLTAYFKPLKAELMELLTEQVLNGKMTFIGDLDRFMAEEPTSGRREGGHAAPNPRPHPHPHPHPKGHVEEARPSIFKRAHHKGV
eukprot:TRINITY_DN17673_c0_g2_i1.p1 TRINITY_DN17673_c0_g2~~TRINITY_DN17673_c0_g2_i1.p1  ORF type:complete len:125 (-),score=21.69 TRINITY_DN17673_c0_g2_i1:105-479(-)